MFTNDEDQMEIEEFDLNKASAGECNRLCYVPITFHEVKSAVHSLKSGKAIGLDDIATIFLKDESETLISGLRGLFNEVFKSGNFHRHSFSVQENILHNL